MTSKTKWEKDMLKAGHFLDEVDAVDLLAGFLEVAELGGPLSDFFNRRRFDSEDAKTAARAKLSEVVNDVILELRSRRWELWAKYDEATKG